MSRVSLRNESRLKLLDMEVSQVLNGHDHDTTWRCISGFAFGELGLALDVDRRGAREVHNLGGKTRITLLPRRSSSRASLRAKGRFQTQPNSNLSMIIP